MFVVSKTHPVTLTDSEFIRRFALHILPKGFTRIRHYGILSSTLKKVIIPVLQVETGEIIITRREPIKHNLCRICGTGKLITLLIFGPRGPPVNLNHFLTNNTLYG